MAGLDMVASRAALAVLDHAMAHGADKTTIRRMQNTVREAALLDAGHVLARNELIRVSFPALRHWIETGERPANWD